jgi:ABC-type dipeptide/oligopeptide/nickel transport system permease subunit
VTVDLRIARSELAALWSSARPGTVFAAFALMLLGLLAVAAPFGGYAVGMDVSPTEAELGPSVRHWLGTDHLGRDVAWRLVLGTGAFAGPGLLAVGTACGVGVPLGALAGFREGVLSQLVRWVFSTLSAIPTIVGVVLAAAIYGATPWVLGIAVGVAAAPSLGELVAARVEELRRAEVVLADRAHGLTELRIAVFHLVFGASGRAIARAALHVFAGFLAVETTLSYLGRFGVQEPRPSWGNMIAGAWGHAGWLPLAAPAAATWLSLVLIHAAAELFAEPADG